MGALNIAFDTTIVGALALSWVVLVIHLFFPEGESFIKDVILSDKVKGLSTVAGVLLFAMAYALGSGVSRTATDFFNDDDLRIDIYEHTFRVGVTEDGIRTRVYCQKKNLLPKSLDSLTADTSLFLRPNSWLCSNALAWYLQAPKNEEEKQYEEDKDLANDIFLVQQSAIQLNGEDKTERVRQLHDQVFVLRGAAFSGLVAFFLCLFAWGAGLHSKLRWVIPLVLLVPAFIALSHHLQDRPLADPPFMEFTLLVLGLSGGYLLWKGARLEKIAAAKWAERKKIRGGLLVLSFLLTVAAFLAWWSTETLYYQQIMYTYYAQARALPK